MMTLKMTASAYVPLWPGITTGHNALYLCIWAPRNGTYQVKVASAICPVPGHARVTR